tara:strand:- start:462 stop:1184 length:723 start_codon:yes stop_codon:yes gene_type:complete
MKFKNITDVWKSFLLETQRPGPGHQQSTYEKKNEIIKMDGWGGATYYATGEKGYVNEDETQTTKPVKPKPAQPTVDWWDIIRSHQPTVDDDCPKGSDCDKIFNLQQCCMENETSEEFKNANQNGLRHAEEWCINAMRGALGKVDRTAQDQNRFGGVSDQMPIEFLKIVDKKKFEELESRWCAPLVAESDLKSKSREKDSVIKRKGKTKDIILGGDSSPCAAMAPFPAEPGLKKVRIKIKG